MSHFLENVVALFSRLSATLVSGVFLLISLALILTKTEWIVDPVWVSIIISGFPLAYNAFRQLIFRHKVTSSLLITIAMAASVIIGESFAAGEIAFIMAIGGILEDRTVDKARRGISQLISLAPLQGRIRDGNKETTVPVEQIAIGQVIRVLPGETIPIDGKIISGETSVDQSIMTGESLPVDKAEGDDVFSGTINRFGSVDILTTKKGEDSSLQKMIRMVHEAEEKKAPTERLVDKWASWIVPAALVIAILTYVFTGEIIRAVTVLVVFCPCALALATPTTIMAAIGQATNSGVLIKSGEALEKMGEVDCITFDKTGTLTHGKLSVSDVIPLLPEVDRESLLSMVAGAESKSEHPLGKAIVTYARSELSHLEEARDFKMYPGKGVSARVAEARVLCGNSLLMKEESIMLTSEAELLQEQFAREGKGTILIARDGILAGLITLSDTLRSTASNVVAELKSISNDVVLLTGDNAQTASFMASNAGIDIVYANLLPADKVEEVKKLTKQGKKVCMIGDGVNDAPALKTSHVGVAMGTMGSDIAIEAADIALMGDNLEKIPYLKRLSNAALRTIKFNITLAMLINFAAIIFSVLGWLNPVTGALVHNIGSILVVLNAAWLYNRNF